MRAGCHSPCQEGTWQEGREKLEVSQDKNAPEHGGGGREGHMREG